jgi:hypothetical protein|tara:strand:- start:105 stop:359 length:255 start_codon:yes stop_codon:yes gene_type:complete
MKVLRIDNQGVLNDRVYKNLEDLKEQLCDFHSIDWQTGIDKDNKDYIDIFSLTLEDIMDHGDWSYEMITNKQANKSHYIKMYDE